MFNLIRASQAAIRIALSRRTDLVLPRSGRDLAAALMIITIEPPHPSAGRLAQSQSPPSGEHADLSERFTDEVFKFPEDVEGTDRQAPSDGLKGMRRHRAMHTTGLVHSFSLGR